MALSLMQVCDFVFLFQYFKGNYSPFRAYRMTVIVSTVKLQIKASNLKQANKTSLVFPY